MATLTDHERTLKMYEDLGMPISGDSKKSYWIWG